jgi:hypothetical protein
MSDADRVSMRFVEEDTWGTTPAGETLADITIDAIAVDQSFNDSDTAFVTNGFVAGQRILVSGFTLDANNGFFTIVSVVAAKMIVAKGALAIVDEAEGDSVSIVTAMTEMRYTADSFKQENTSVESAEIRGDRQIADVKRSSVEASGDLSFELSYAAHDDFFEAALQSPDWSDVATDTQITFSAAISDNSFNDSGSGFVSAGFLQYQWIKVSGFTLAANNGYFKIASVVAGKIIVTGGTLADEVAGDTVTIEMGAQIYNATTQRSFSVEKEFTDLPNEFLIYVGMTLSTMNLAVDASSIVTGDFGFMGKTEASATASAAGAGGSEDAAENDIMGAVDEVESFLEAQSALSIVSATISLDNNLRSRMEVGEVGPVSFGAGKSSVSGDVEIYFESKAIMDKFRDQTETSLALTFEDEDGNGYVIDMPRVKYSAAEQAVSGENTDVVAKLGFVAYREEDEDITIRIARFAA